MTPNVKMNFPSDVEFSKQFWACSGCADIDNGGGGGIGSRGTQQHIMVCPGYAEFREGINLENDRDLVKYFAELIKQRPDDDNG